MNRTVIITGAGIGIGRATALAFGEAGYRVIITDVLDEEGERVAGMVTEAGGSAQFRHLDVTSTDEVNQVVESVVKEFGAPQAVVANAGIALREPFSAMTDQRWQRTLDVDLNGVMRIFRAAAPSMRASGRGSMIALSSIMGFAYGWDQHAHYSAAKAGVVGLVRGLAVELAAEGIRVNGIAPGFIRTAQALSVEHSVGPAGLEAAASYIPMRRVGEPEDIADVALFLASEQARYITGQVIAVDGGLLVGRY